MNSILTATKAEVYRIATQGLRAIQVSIIIPCFNVACYIERSIKSALPQSGISLEIIVVDDGSTDNTVEVVQNLQKNDSRIKLIRMGSNGGVAMARNEGLKKAKGEYIAFLDSDDYVDCEYYSTLYELATRTGADIAKGGATGVHNIIELVNNNKYYFYAQWWSAIYSKSLIMKHNLQFPNLISGQDFVFQRFAVFYANKVVAIDAPHYHYCKRPGSLDSPVFTIDKIDSNLRGRMMIAEMARMIEKKEDYFIVMHRLLSEVHWFWNKTSIPAYHDYILNAFKMIFDSMRYKNEFIVVHPELEAILKERSHQSARDFFTINIDKYKYNYEVR